MFPAVSTRKMAPVTGPLDDELLEDELLLDELDEELLLDELEDELELLLGQPPVMP